jgi:archaemetzincin
VPARVEEVAERPAAAFDPRRGQHSSTRILEWLEARRPDDAHLLGLTDGDLFIPILTFVFGEARLRGAAAVVSTARLVPGAAPALWRARLAKEAVHELGHTLGLLHCETLGCVMTRSSSVKDVDAKRPGPCSDCRARLREAERGMR